MDSGHCRVARRAEQELRGEGTAGAGTDRHTKHSEGNRDSEPLFSLLLASSFFL